MGRPQQNNLDLDTFVGKVAHNLRRLRRRAKLAVSECCDDTGISTTTWYVLEAGTRAKIDGATLDVIADYFDVNVSGLTRKPQ